MTMMSMKTLLTSCRLSTTRQQNVTGCSLSATARLFVTNTRLSSQKKRHRKSITKFRLPTPSANISTETTTTTTTTAAATRNCCPRYDRQRTIRTCSFLSTLLKNSSTSPYHYSLPLSSRRNDCCISAVSSSTTIRCQQRDGLQKSPLLLSFILAPQRQLLLLPHAATARLELGLLPPLPSRRHQQQMISFYGSTSPPPPPPVPADEDSDKNRQESNSSNSKTVLLSHWIQQLKSIPNIITCTRIACAPLLSYWIITQQHEAALYGCLLAGFSDYMDGLLAKRYHMQTTLGTYLDPLADKILINVLAVSVWYTEMLPTPLVVLWMGKDVLLMTATYQYVASHTPRQYNNNNNVDVDNDKDNNNTLRHNQQQQQQQYVMDPLSTPLKVEPTVTSKINTALQFVTLAMALVHPLCVVDAVAAVAGTDGVATTATATTTATTAVYYYLDPALYYLCWITGGTTILSVFSYVGYSAFTDSGNNSSNQKK